MLRFAQIAVHNEARTFYAVAMRYTDDPSTDTPRDISRLIVPEAARALGISPEAVRNRLSRGTLDSIKENGTVYVLLEADRARLTDDTPNDRARSTDDISSDTPDAHTAALVAAKDETINLLRSQLEAEREANRENRRIIAGLVQRVPELEAPRNGHETATAEPDRGEHPPATDGAQEGAGRRSGWWRRLFLGEA
jgi:DNA-binding Lrp family transcriptional regulator